jgi:hypothetical protein
MALARQFTCILTDTNLSSPKCHGTEVYNKTESSFPATPVKVGGDPESRHFKDFCIPAK